MKEDKSPKTIEEYLSLDKRKCEVIVTKAIFTDISKRIKKLEKNR